MAVYVGNNPPSTGLSSSSAAFASTSLFAFAVSIYSGLADGFEVGFNKGTVGDYALDNVGGTGSGSINSGAGTGGILTLDTGASANGTVGVHPTGSPVVVLSMKTGAPWFAYGYSKLAPGTTDNVTQTYGCGLTSSASAGTTRIVCGVRGARDTAHLSLETYNGSFVGAASTTAPFAGFAWYCIGFDGTTLSMYAATTIATLSTTPLATVTDLSQMTTGAAMPWVIVANGATAASRASSLDKYGVFYALA